MILMGKDIRAWSAVVVACHAIDISFSTTYSASIRCTSSLLRIKCPRHKLLSYRYSAPPRAMSRLLERVRQVNTGERCTRHCRMDIACTASHVIGPRRQGNLWDDVFLLVDLSFVSGTKPSTSSFRATLMECFPFYSLRVAPYSTLCSSTKTTL